MRFQFKKENRRVSGVQGFSSQVYFSFTQDGNRQKVQFVVRVVLLVPRRHVPDAAGSLALARVDAALCGSEGIAQRELTANTTPFKKQERD